MMSSKPFWTKKTLVGIGLGQFLSLLITSTGFSSSELAKKGINAPTSQSFLNYVLLTVVYGSVMLYKRQPLKAKRYYYVVLGLVDVEANFLVVKAYQYTSITSVMLLDCWSIPCVMFLTFIFLKTKYRFRKIAGVVVCVAGLVMVVFSDVHAGDRSGGSDPRKGDLLVFAGATLYAISNVSEGHILNLNSEHVTNIDASSKIESKPHGLYNAQITEPSREFLVKNADRVELMSFLGLFGAIISAIQISLVERNELKSIHWTAGAAFPFFGFSLAMFLFYSFVPVLLKMSGSTMLNLSLLTSDMWAVIIRIFAYHEKVDWLYFLAFAVVAVGLIIYSVVDKGEGQHQRQAGVANEDVERSKHFDEEAGSNNINRGTMAGSLKTEDSNKHDRTAIVNRSEIIENKNVGKDVQEKKS